MWHTRGWEREQPTNAVISNFNEGLLLIHALVTRRVKFWSNICATSLSKHTARYLPIWLLPDESGEASSPPIWANQCIVCSAKDKFQLRSYGFFSVQTEPPVSANHRVYDRHPASSIAAHLLNLSGNALLDFAKQRQIFRNDSIYLASQIYRKFRFNSIVREEEKIFRNKRGRMV